MHQRPGPSRPTGGRYRWTGQDISDCTSAAKHRTTLPARACTRAAAAQQQCGKSAAIKAPVAASLLHRALHTPPWTSTSAGTCPASQGWTHLHTRHGVDEHLWASHCANLHLCQQQLLAAEGASVQAVHIRWPPAALAGNQQLSALHWQLSAAARPATDLPCISASQQHQNCNRLWQLTQPDTKSALQHVGRRVHLDPRILGCHLAQLPL